MRDFFNVKKCITPLVLVFSGFAVQAQEVPKMGGTLEVLSLYSAIPTMSWDTADWAWRQNHDMGLVYEQLFAANLNKSKRNGGAHAFRVDAWLPKDGMRGELAQTWRWTGATTMEVTLRKGVMFPAKQGVMAARELTAEDVVYSYKRMNSSPHKLPNVFDHIKSVIAKDRYTVVFNFHRYTADWDSRYGWGYFSSIVPKEVVEAGAGDWKNINGTGPYKLVNYMPGNALVFSRNDNYYDVEKVGSKYYKMPFLDKIAMRFVKDASTRETLLRTGKVDILESIPWTSYAELKKNAPQLKWAKSLSSLGQYMAMRVDTKPFNDVRVRQALNMAIDKREIVKAYYGGNAVLHGYPVHPDSHGYYEPLEQMPAEVRELFEFNPNKAKQLLAQAGYPKGFTFKVQVCGCAPDQMDLLPLMAAYLEKVGVRMEIQPLEYGAYASTVMAGKHASAVMMITGHGNPITTLGKNFYSGQAWNVSRWHDPKLDASLDKMLTIRDEKQLQAEIKRLNREVMAQAPYIFLPIQYGYTAWWPWVKNYGGELRAGAERPGPIYARIWIDLALKKKMGY